MKLPKINKTNKNKTILNRDTLCKCIAGFSFLTLILSLGIQVTTTNKFAIKGSEMVALQKSKFEIEKEISALELKLSEEASLASIEVRAYELGFVEYSQPIAVVGNVQFAALR